jgi:hypothetical protein
MPRWSSIDPAYRRHHPRKPHVEGYADLTTILGNIGQTCLEDGVAVDQLRRNTLMGGAGAPIPLDHKQAPIRTKHNPASKLALVHRPCAVDLDQRIGARSGTTLRRQRVKPRRSIVSSASTQISEHIASLLMS